MADRSLLARARDDVGVFAEALVGEPLWPHQLAFARSDARTRSALWGRQSGKSRTMGVLALHEAFRGRDRLVLVVSATEMAARRLLEEIGGLASSRLLAGAVVDENKGQIVLTNGSRIVSVPSSLRQVRGWTAHLLIVDEACFVADEVIEAARFTTVTTGGRVVMASTPWGRRDRKFAAAFDAGERDVEGYASFRNPSTVSPLVSDSVLSEWRETMTDREYRAEVLAEWVDDAGAYFTAAELERARDGYDLVPLAAGRDMVEDCSAGVDWGFAHDASVMTVLCEDPSDGALWLPWISERFGVPYDVFIAEVVAAAEAFDVRQLVTETNGVGQYPSAQLAERLSGTATHVEPITTTAALKQDAFGAIKLLFQQDRLKLPDHPALLRQLSNLEFEQRDSGSMAISVPERLGHDDCAMGLVFAVWADRRVKVGRTSSRRAVVRASVSESIGARPPSEPTSDVAGVFGSNTGVFY